MTPSSMTPLGNILTKVMHDAFEHDKPLLVRQ